jgi:hypothetical protein
VHLSEEEEAKKEKRMTKLVGDIVVKTMSKYKEQMDTDTFKRFAKEVGCQFVLQIAMLMYIVHCHFGREGEEGILVCVVSPSQSLGRKASKDEDLYQGVFAQTAQEIKGQGEIKETVVIKEWTGAISRVSGNGAERRSWRDGLDAF